MYMSNRSSMNYGSRDFSKQVAMTTLILEWEGQPNLRISHVFIVN